MSVEIQNKGRIANGIKLEGILKEEGIPYKKIISGETMELHFRNSAYVYHGHENAEKIEGISICKTVRNHIIKEQII